MLPGDPFEKKLDSLETEIVYGGLTDREAITAACKDVDEIIHAGAVMTERPPGMDDIGHFDVNTRSTLLLLDAAQKSQVTRFVYFSSTAVFDVSTYPIDQLPIRDDSAHHPLSYYGLTKSVSEQIVEGYHALHGLPTVILRPNYIMACNEPAEAWSVEVVISVLENCPQDPRVNLHVPGVDDPAAPVRALAVDPQTPCIPRNPDGACWQWHVVDVRDVIQAVLRSLEASAAIGQAFNIAGPMPMDHEIAANHLATKTGTTPIEVEIPNPYRFWFDLSRAQDILGYHPQYDIRRMIDDAMAFKEGQDIGVIPTT